jgi:hypothetical protein
MESTRASRFNLAHHVIRRGCGAPAFGELPSRLPHLLDNTLPPALRQPPTDHINKLSLCLIRQILYGFQQLVESNRWRHGSASLLESMQLPLSAVNFTSQPPAGQSIGLDQAVADSRQVHARLRQGDRGWRPSPRLVSVPETDSPAWPNAAVSMTPQDSTKML